MMLKMLIALEFLYNLRKNTYKQQALRHESNALARVMATTNQG